MAKPVFRKFIEVDKHQIWSVKWQNNGQPVVLLHGGLSHTAKWEKQILPAVAKTHQPFAYDRTAHGYTKVRAGYMHFDFQVNELKNQPTSLVGVMAAILDYLRQLNDPISLNL
jgi:pimeloyl-ACP methyl ester carboxylesterase